MKHYFVLMLLVLSCSSLAYAATSTMDDQDSIEVTVYNSNMALVKDTRHLQLTKGNGELRFMDVASSIMPQTVHIHSLTPAAQLNIWEQNYEYDLMDQHKLLDKYVGKTIKIKTTNQYQDKSEVVEAQLLSNNNGQIYKIGEDIYLDYPGYKILPGIPENLVAKPTLTWLYDSQINEPQSIQVSYITNNVNWMADYILVVDKDDALANLSGWVTLDNQSGAIYKDAKLKLVAGQVNRVQPVEDNMMAKGDVFARAEMASAPQFEEKAFFEYHIYDLQRKTTIKDNQKKQISLLEAKDVHVAKEYEVNGQQQYFYSNYMGNAQPIKEPVNVFLKFKNAQTNQLGMPLPAGIVRLYKEDTDKSMQFIGEDAIKHTPKDEDVSLKVGEAFDIVSERVQLDFQQNNRSYETEWEVTLRNHKDVPVTVAVIEPVYGDWEILKSSQPYKKVNSSNIRFDVVVPKDQEVKISYRIRVKI